MNKISYLAVGIPVLFIYMLYALCFGFNPQTWSSDCKVFWIFAEMISASASTVIISEYNKK